MTTRVPRFKRRWRVRLGIRSPPAVSRQGPRRTLLPVEPLLHVTAHRDERVEALAALSGRVA